MSEDNREDSVYGSVIYGRNRIRYSDEYRDNVFWIWYNAGKPDAGKLWAMLKDDQVSPEIKTLREWINTDFRERAEMLDEEINEVIIDKAVAEKIEMLERHTKTAVTMQNIALEYLNNHKEDLNAYSAIRLLVEGIRIERESRGIPEALRKMADMSDDKLLEEIKKLLSAGQSYIESIDTKDELLMLKSRTPVDEIDRLKTLSLTYSGSKKSWFRCGENCSKAGRNPFSDR